MVNFAIVTTFRTRLSALLKVKRGVYAAVPDEICIAFKNATIEQIRQNRDMVLLNNDAVVIKLRLPDKKQHLSKADGYRLIYLVLKEKSVVILLDVYPWLLIVFGFLTLNMFPGYLALACMVIGIVILIERVWPEKWGDDVTINI